MARRADARRPPTARPRGEPLRRGRPRRAAGDGGLMFDHAATGSRPTTRWGVSARRSSSSRPAGSTRRSKTGGLRGSTRGSDSSTPGEHFTCIAFDRASPAARAVASSSSPGGTTQPRAQRLARSPRGRSRAAPWAAASAARAPAPSLSPTRSGRPGWCSTRRRGGPRYRLTQHARFDQHEAFVRQRGLQALVELARTSDETFAQDPRLGPAFGRHPAPRRRRVPRHRRRHGARPVRP